MIQVEKQIFKDMYSNGVIQEWNITSKNKSKGKRKKHYVPLTSKVKKYLNSKGIEFVE